METAIKEEKAEGISEGKKGKRKWLSAFINFLAMGGFLIVLIGVVAIVVLISVLIK